MTVKISGEFQKCSTSIYFKVLHLGNECIDMLSVTRGVTRGGNCEDTHMGSQPALPYGAHMGFAPGIHMGPIYLEGIPL